MHTLYCTYIYNKKKEKYHLKSESTQITTETVLCPASSYSITRVVRLCCLLSYCTERVCVHILEGELPGGASLGLCCHWSSTTLSILLSLWGKKGWMKLTSRKKFGNEGWTNIWMIQGIYYVSYYLFSFDIKRKGRFLIQYWQSNLVIILGKMD